MLRTCILDFGENWSQYLTLVEFAYNNSFHSSIQMAPYEILYGQKCRSPIHWDKVGEKKILDSTTVPWIEEAFEKVKLIRQRIRTAQSRQKNYVNNQRKDLEFEIGDKVFLKITPLKASLMARKGKKYPELFVDQGINFENEILLRGKACEDPKFFFNWFIYLFIYLFIHFIQLIYFIHFNCICMLQCLDLYFNTFALKVNFSVAGLVKISKYAFFEVIFDRRVQWFWRIKDAQL